MKRWPLLTPVAIFAVACFLPAIDFRYTNGTHDPMWGFSAALTGWSGIFVGIHTWFANPLWLLGLILAFFRKRIAAVALGLLTIPIALTTYSVLGRELPADEGNVNHMTAMRLLPAFYVWIAALASMPLAALFVGPKRAEPIAERFSRN